MDMFLPSSMLMGQQVLPWWEVRAVVKCTAKQPLHLHMEELSFQCARLFLSLVRKLGILEKRKNQMGGKHHHFSFTKCVNKMLQIFMEGKFYMAMSKISAFMFPCPTSALSFIYVLETS